MRRGLQLLAGVAGIFALSSVPQSTLSSLNPGVASAWGHFLEYGLLGWLYFRWHEVARTGGLAGIARGILFVLLVAAADEAYQSLVPGRLTEAFDLGVDVVGFATGALVTARVRRRAAERSATAGDCEGKR